MFWLSAGLGYAFLPPLMGEGVLKRSPDGVQWNPGFILVGMFNRP
jgi:hypothetical protein